MRAYLYLISLFALTPMMALASPPAPTFRPDAWSEGVHLLTGFGLNSAVFNSDTARITLGLGTNFKADVGWFFTDRLAAEIGSAVKFNRSDDYLIWDTLITLGIRYRFHSILFGSDGTFTRAFVGEAPTVIYLGDRNNPFKAIGASRAQINGPLVGLGGGCFYQTKGGLNWFIEWDVAYQWLRFTDVVADKNDVPIVIQSSETDGRPNILSLALNIGLVLF
jgi:hypothetical protein